MCFYTWFFYKKGGGGGRLSGSRTASLQCKTFCFEEVLKEAAQYSFPTPTDCTASPCQCGRSVLVSTQFSRPCFKWLIGHGAASTQEHQLSQCFAKSPGRHELLTAAMQGGESQLPPEAALVTLLSEANSALGVMHWGSKSVCVTSSCQGSLRAHSHQELVPRKSFFAQL